MTWSFRVARSYRVTWTKTASWSWQGSLSQVYKILSNASNLCISLNDWTCINLFSWKFNEDSYGVGGYIGLIIGEGYFVKHPEYAGNIEPCMRELQEAGVWTRIRRELFPRYHGEYDGIEFVLQLNDDKNKALQTLEWPQRDHGHGQLVIDNHVIVVRLN